MAKLIIKKTEKLCISKETHGYYDKTVLLNWIGRMPSKTFNFI